MQVISRLRQTYNIELPLKTIFEHPTIYALSKEIKSIIGKNFSALLPPIMSQTRPKEIPLSFAEQRLWFLDQLLPNTSLYNIHLAFTLSGVLRLDIFERASNALIKRHESLRTLFPTIQGKAQQVIQQYQINIADCLVDLALLSQSDQKVHLKNLSIAEENTIFDLSSGPLIRFKIARLSEYHHVLFITMHHIISDGWSIDIIFKELSEYYNAYLQDREPLLPTLTIQYADFTLWQRAWLQGEVLEAQLNFWKQELTGIPDLLALPTDKTRPKELSYKGAYYEYSLSSEITEALNQLSHKQGSSLFMILLALLQVLLYRYTGSKI